MKLSYTDKDNLLKQFPNIELSYEKKIHKKIHSTDFTISIPKGLKYFAWFQNYKGKNICFFLKLYRRRQIADITIKKCCFNHDLCIEKGTILFGTIFLFNKIQFFNIEDVFFFKNKNLSNHSQYKKLQIINTIFKRYIKQLIICKNDIIFGLPVYSKSGAINDFSNLPYELYCIQHRSLQKKSVYYNQSISIRKEKIFLVKPQIMDDIYELYHMKNNELEFFDYAFIRDYKTSVFMNSLFRKIKENKNLDALEESDDEDEFEDVRPDKYVFLEKTLKISCMYNSRFKKWKPYKIAPKSSNISSL
tara:strand:+ start:452 stop:1363 length:912 start_codon:yes stop_codon:yes gene_type:complete